MALNSGYDRYEGLAYFGYDMDSEGIDAVVVLGERAIEIRNNMDQTLSIWAPGSFTVNHEEIPLRAYFSGSEWLAPRDEELRGMLDRFMETPDAMETETNSSAQKSPIRWGVWLGVLFLLFIMVILLIKPLSSSLLDTSIRESLDHQLTQSLTDQREVCNIDQEKPIHQLIDNAYPRPEFKIYGNLGRNFARLPSGKLAIDENFASKLGSAQQLIALKQLANTQNLREDAGSAIIGNLKLQSKFRFILKGEVDPEELSKAWDEFNQTDALQPDLLDHIDQPLGDYQKLSKHLPDWPEDEYPSVAAEITIGDQDWLSLITLCDVTN